MRILIMGGTRFVGRHIARVALEHDHQVTLLHRTSTELFPEAEHLLADRDGDLSMLAGRDFDATIDVSAYFPGQVRSLADALDGRGGHYLVISSTSVYAEPAGPGFDESSPTVAPAEPGTDIVDDETYGRLKVSIELLVREIFGAAATIVRPTYVIGADDYTRRFTSWVQRLAAGGEVLGPGDPADPIQVIDVHDLAQFCVRLVEDRRGATFHAVSPEFRYTFGDMLADIFAVVAPSGTTITWVDQQWLLDQGEDDSSIPLWGGGDAWIGANEASPAAARAAGLGVRPVQQSVWELVEHLVIDPPVGDGPGLSRLREAELLAAWHARA